MAQVSTASGAVAGVADETGFVFRGMPYAAAPIGPRRFRPPQRPTRWDGVRPAERFGPIVPQNRAAGVFHDLFAPTHEPGPDCLNLNVWTPDPGAAGLPVMVWLHGGAFSYGAGSDSIYRGAAFARDGVVAVTLNYRLGAAGFHHLAAVAGEADRVVEAEGSGVYGLLDQIAALEWVQENIVAFGGDPANVTVAGESAGAMCVGLLLSSPAAKGLFRRAVLQSGAAGVGVAPDDARAVALALAEAVGIDPADADAWRALDDDRLLAGQRAVLRQGVAPLPWAPLVDGGFAPAADVDVLIGTCRDEHKLFTGLMPELFGGHDADGADAADALDAVDAADAVSAADSADALHALSAAETERLYRQPARRLAEAQHAAGGRVHMYRLSWESPAFDGRIGAAHGTDLPFVWDNLADPMAAKLLGPEPPQALADEMHGAWVRFVTTGDPGWTRYEPAQPRTRDFGGPSPYLEDGLAP